MTWVGRSIAAVIALVLVAASVMPLVAAARGDAPTAHLHDLEGAALEDHDHGHDGPDTGDLVHHAHAHAQTVTPAAVASVAVRVSGTDVRFRPIDDRVPGGREDRAPFEPPRA